MDAMAAYNGIAIRRKAAAITFINHIFSILQRK
jgi:hypothetical protein